MGDSNPMHLDLELIALHKTCVDCLEVVSTLEARSKRCIAHVLFNEILTIRMCDGVGCSKTCMLYHAHRDSRED